MCCFAYRSLLDERIPPSSMSPVSLKSSRDDCQSLSHFDSEVDQIGPISHSHAGRVPVATTLSFGLDYPSQNGLVSGERDNLPQRVL